MSVRFVPDIERPRESVVFEKNMLQCGYLEVDRGSSNMNGRNSILGSFVICKLTNKLMIMEKNCEM